MNTVGRVRALVVVFVVVGVGVAALASWRAPDTFMDNGWVPSATGPVGAADRDLLSKVQQAGMWEMPVGDDLAARAKDPKVRAIGKKISTEHMELNDKTVKAAAQLDVALPGEASIEQQSWVREVRLSDDPDALAVNLLRQAHGKVLPLLAQVRVSTRNDTIRAFASEAMVYVNRHIDYLESTGLVDYTALPDPPAPIPTVSPVKASYYHALDHPTLAFALAALLVIVAIVAYTLRPRRRSNRPIPPPSRHGRRSAR